MLALTLTLSPRRGNRQWPHRKNSLIGELFPAREKIFPLPGGEGQGEGEREFQLTSSGFSLRPSDKLMLGLLFFRHLRDDARSAFVGEIGVSPLQQHGEFVAKADQENQMNHKPGQPRQPAGEM